MGEQGEGSDIAEEFDPPEVSQDSGDEVGGGASSSAAAEFRTSSILEVAAGAASPSARADTTVEPPPEVPSSLPSALWENIWLPTGKITWYKKYNRFEATCKRPSHGRCVLTRSGNMSMLPGCGGRPLGLMAAWMNASATDAPDKVSHLAFAVELEHEAQFGRRMAERERLKTTASATNLFAREAPRRPGEQEEPAGKPS